MHYTTVLFAVVAAFGTPALAAPIATPESPSTIAPLFVRDPQGMGGYQTKSGWKRDAEAQGMGGYQTESGWKRDAQPQGMGGYKTKSGWKRDAKAQGMGGYQTKSGW